jgi:hypothetical protein
VYGILYCAEEGEDYSSAVVVDMETARTLCVFRLHLLPRRVIALDVMDPVTGTLCTVVRDRCTLVERLLVYHEQTQTCYYGDFLTAEGQPLEGFEVAQLLVHEDEVRVYGMQGEVPILCRFDRVNTKNGWCAKWKRCHKMTKRPSQGFHVLADYPDLVIVYCKDRPFLWSQKHDTILAELKLRTAGYKLISNIVQKVATFDSVDHVCITSLLTVQALDSHGIAHAIHNTIILWWVAVRPVKPGMVLKLEPVEQVLLLSTHICEWTAHHGVMVCINSRSNVVMEDLYTFHTELSHNRWRLTPSQSLTESVNTPHLSQILNCRPLTLQEYNIKSLAGRMYIVDKECVYRLS